jgi:hypothetical protein
MAGHVRAWFGALGGVLAVALVAGTVVAAVPAAAQERDRGDEHARAPERGDRGDHGRPDDRRPQRRRVVHDRREAPPVYGYDVPTYVPDPPPVVYAPPAPSSSGLNLFFSFR